MPLTTTVEVERLGALIPQLFDTDQAGMDAIVLDAITDADNWMQVYLGANYGGLTAPETAVQARGQALLSMSYVEPILRAKKVRGTHFPIDSEESTAYEDLLEKDWEGLARSLLAKWISLEPTGGTQNFALPYFQATDSPDPLVTDGESIRIRDIDDEARGKPEVVFPTVTA
jgi:hypothetical protein